MWLGTYLGGTTLVCLNHTHGFRVESQICLLSMFFDWLVIESQDPLFFSPQQQPEAFAMAVWGPRGGGLDSGNNDSNGSKGSKFNNHTDNKGQLQEQQDQ